MNRNQFDELISQQSTNAILVKRACAAYERHYRPSADMGFLLCDVYAVLCYLFPKQIAKIVKRKKCVVETLGQYGRGGLFVDSYDRSSFGSITIIEECYDDTFFGIMRLFCKGESFEHLSRE